MRKNTLFHHKQQVKKSNNYQKQVVESKQFIIENPENSAKFCLLEISQEQSKNINLRNSNSPDTNHYRSYSTEFFTNKYKITSNNSSSLINQNSSNQQNATSNAYRSVALKSTFSNQMRKKYNDSFYKTSYNSSIFSQNMKQKTFQKQNQQKFRKTNYFPFTVHEQKHNQKTNHIFKSTPSKQILSFLKKTGLVKDIKITEKIEKEYNIQQIKSRKKSIFNIRPLILKNQDNTIEMVQKKRNVSPPKSLFSTKRLSPDFIPQGEIHSSNRNTIKLRMKTRNKRSSMSQI